MILSRALILHVLGGKAEFAGRDGECTEKNNEFPIKKIFSFHSNSGFEVRQNKALHSLISTESAFPDIFKISAPKNVSPRLLFCTGRLKKQKGSKFNTFLSRAAAFLTAGTTMWRVGELLRTALSLFRDLRNLAEDVAQSCMGPGSVFPVW